MLMNSRLVKDLPELLEKEVISKDVANRIKAYYKLKNEGKPNRLFTVFGVLGATMVGLGIILILAHNWDDFSRTIKTVWAFLPLVIGQLCVGYAILRNKGDTWKEAAGVFLFFAVGASIALVSQIYNIPGDLSSFLLIWILLCAPLLYLLKSKAVAILHIAFATYYVIESGYSNGSRTPWFYLLFLAGLLPFYGQLLKLHSKSNITSIFNWLVPISVTICLGAFVGRGDDEMGFFMYVILFGVFYNLGKLPYFRDQKLRRNGYLIIGSLGTIVTLLIVSFTWYWDEVFKEVSANTQSMVITGVLYAMALMLVLFSHTKKLVKELTLFRYAFILFSMLFFIGMINVAIPTVLVNFLVLSLGLMAIKIGVDKMHFGILNYGLLIVTALVICRFFDTNMTFVIRGLLFVLVGLGFFLTNYIMLKKQKSNT